jgi:hypothetical protein
LFSFSYRRPSAFIGGKYWICYFLTVSSPAASASGRRPAAEPCARRRNREYAPPRRPRRVRAPAPAAPIVRAGQSYAGGESFSLLERAVLALPDMWNGPAARQIRAGKRNVTSGRLLRVDACEVLRETPYLPPEVAVDAQQFPARAGLQHFGAALRQDRVDGETDHRAEFRR